MRGREEPALVSKVTFHTHAFFAVMLLLDTVTVPIVDSSSNSDLKMFTLPGTTEVTAIVSSPTVALVLGPLL